MNRLNMLIALVVACVTVGPICARVGGGHGGGHGGGGFHGGGHGGGAHGHGGRSHGGSSHHGYSHGGHHGGSHWQQGHYYPGRGYYGYRQGFGWGFWPIAYAAVASTALIGAAVSSDLSSEDEQDQEMIDEEQPMAEESSFD